MAKSTVYYFNGYDIRCDQVIRSKRPAPLEAIKLFNGVPLMNTAMQVDSDRLDGNGFYVDHALASDLVANR